jgi:hypothetical protein
MSLEETIRTRYPLNLAKLYEALCLESEPRLRVSKLVDLYEATVRHLALLGLAVYRHQALSDDPVAAARADLRRPSLGHWLSLLKALDAALGQRFPLVTPPLNQRYRDDPVAAAVERLAPMVGTTVPKRIRFSFFLDVVVEFRNKKIGHGSLSPPEARQVVTPLEAALSWWLGQLTLLQTRPLIYVKRVEVQGPQRYTYHGTNLSAGTSLYPVHQVVETAVLPRQVYLGPGDASDAEAWIPLHPWFAFNADTSLLHVYHELSSQGRPVLRCPYEPSSLKSTLELEVAAEEVLGAAPPEPPPQPQTEPSLPGLPSPAPESTVRRKRAMVKSWYDVIQPHADIRKGHFDESVFAADLGDVIDAVAAPDYNDPYLFFSKTYFTHGLTNLLTRVYGKLTTGQGPSVIQIQTPFGGGKTHALVAIYHYLKHGQRAEELLPQGVKLLSPHVCAVAGNHWEPLQGRTTEGVTRRTFWGELAFQIGGREGYEVLRENDERGISPGKDKLRAFLEAHQPFVILFDEILEYINRALDVRDQTDVSLGTQTFSFFQELTEAVAVLPRGMLVVTLPSSHLEDFGDREEESLARMGRIFGRVESIETPVQGEEVYAVIRRRLFEEETLRAVPMRQIVHRYFQCYQQHHDDLPPKARDPNYKDKMELAYPFHPDLIDILYEKWSTFPTFQRTRGVLRLLANVVEDLYQREVALDLILPGDVNLEHTAIRQEFLKHVGREYEGVLGSDIAGHEAKAQALDRANRSWKHLAQRVSTAIFVHSFSADDSEKGVSLPYVKLATLREDDIPALVTDVLQRLSNELWYLNKRAAVYYFSRIPNLNRMVLDKKELFNENYETEMRRIIEAEIGRQFTPYLWPESAEGIRDNRELKLVLLRPEDAGNQIPQWIERRGERFREYKNTLFFALADVAGFARLREDVKTVMALREIKISIDAGESPQLEARRDEIARRLRDIERDFSYNVRRMYHILQAGERRIDLGQPTAGKETLSHWYWRELTSADVGAIATQLSQRTLKAKFLADREQIATATVLDQFYKNPELPAPAEPGVVARAIQLAVQDGALGLAEGHDDQLDPDTLKHGQTVPLDAITFEPGEVLLSRAKSAELLAQVTPPEAPAVPPVGGETPPPPGPEGQAPPSTSGPTAVPPEPETGPAAEKRYRRVRLVIADVPAARIADVNRGILRPITTAFGHFTFTLTVDVSDPEGISQGTLENTIKETVRQIGARVVEERVE